MCSRVEFSLSEEDLATSTHVAASLSGALVGAGLEAHDGLTSFQHLVREVTLVLLRGLGSQVGSLPLRVFVGLKKKTR